jgi:hypothetical protein
LTTLGLAQGGLVVAGEVHGEEALELFHGGGNDVVVTAADPILGRSEHQLQHGAVGIFVLPAGVAHVGIHAEQVAAAEQQVVDLGELAVKPEVDVDHRGHH